MQSVGKLRKALIDIVAMERECGRLSRVWKEQRASQSKGKVEFLAQAQERVRVRVWAGLRYDLAMLKNLGFTGACN